MSTHNGNGKIENIEKEIDRDRAHLNETIRALENKLSPGQLVDQVWGYARRNGGDFSDNLVRTISSNPVPVILAGIGIAWTAMSQRRGSEWATSDPDYPASASYGVDPDYDSEFDFNESDSDEGLAGKARDKAGGLRDKAGGLKGSLSDRMHRAGSKASGMSRSASHSARTMGSRGRHQLNRASHDARDFMEQNPLAVGAMALAAGALVGALLPVTSREKKFLGDNASGAVEKTRSAAQKSMDSITRAGKEGARAAKETLESSSSRETQSG